MKIRQHRLGWIGLFAGLALVAGSARAQTAGPTGERLVRSWQDKVKVHGRDEDRTVQVVYDYDTGVSLRRTYDASGALLVEQILGAQPQPSPAEIEEAFEVVRSDASLGDLARRVGAHFDGGFVLEEAAGEPCGPHTRCLQVFMLSSSRWGLHRHSAVDLRGRRIAHRSFRSGRTD